MARRRTISYTEVTAAMDCEVKHDFSYGGRLAGSTLKPRELRTVLSNGRAWGAGVAALHSHSTDFMRSLYASDAMSAALAADRVESAERTGVMPEVGLMVVQSNRLAMLLERYVEVAPLLDNLTHLEGEIVVPIPGTRMNFQCFLDGFTVDSKYGRRLVEFKLRGALSDPGVILLNRQPLWYAWAYRELLRQLGLPDDLDGVFIDEMLNELPKNPSIVQNGKESPLLYTCSACGVSPGFPCVGKVGDLKTAHPIRREQTKMTYRPSHAVDQITTPELYVAACAEYNVEPEPETVEALGNRVWHQRIPLTYTTEELDEAGLELLSAARKIRELDSGKRYPIRNGRRSCKGCDYFKICAHPEDDMLVETMFVRGVPKRLR